MMLFSGCEINMQPCMEMDLSVWPHAIAWMDKGGNVYDFLQAAPSLLEKFVVMIRLKKRSMRMVENGK
jgi:hypothetical protein